MTVLWNVKKNMFLFIIFYFLFNILNISMNSYIRIGNVCLKKEREKREREKRGQLMGIDHRRTTSVNVPLRCPVLLPLFLPL